MTEVPTSFPRFWTTAQSCVSAQVFSKVFLMIVAFALKAIALPESVEKLFHSISRLESVL
jgi:hypothetical protein